MKNALNQKISKLKEDLKTLTILFFIILIVFKIFFFNEPFFNLLKVYWGLWWVFVLPGFILLFYWHDNLDFLERFLLGIGISAAFIGISSYYLGLIGINTKYHGIILPTILLIMGLAIIYFRDNRIKDPPVYQN